MRGGLIRRRLTIQRASSTANSLGEPVQSWTTLYSAWGSVDAVSAQERFASGSQQELATVTHRIRLRYRDDKVIKPTDRVSFDSKVFDIESAVDPDGRRRELLLLCRELVDL